MESLLGSPRGFDLPTGLMKSPVDDFAVSRSSTQRLKGTLNEEPDHEAADESVANGRAHDQNLFSSIQYISVSATILDDSAVIHQNHSSTLPLILLQSADKVGSDIMGLTQVRRNANQTCEKFTKACGRVRNLTIVVDDMGMTTEGKRAQFGRGSTLATRAQTLSGRSGMWRPSMTSPGNTFSFRTSMMTYSKANRKSSASPCCSLTRSLWK